MIVTIKRIVLNDKKEINEIKKGTILKRYNDLFIVTEVIKERVEDPIHEALFFSTTPRTSLRKERVEGKYQLTSLSTGGSFFETQDSLQTLLRKISDNGRFEIVESIEIKEV